MEIGTENTLVIKGAPMAKNGQIEITNIPVNKIKIGKNSRTSISPGALEGLMESIKEQGLLQPIGLVKVKDHYEICYGNRRYLAVTKLGLQRIPAIIHENKNATDVDMKNLTENIQRRNLGIEEIGRYIDLLQKGKLTTGEIAVRLGVGETYVRTCLAAYNEVPEKFKKDLEVSLTTNQFGKLRKNAAGKISVNVVSRILSEKKRLSLTETQTEKLFTAAKSDDRFDSQNIRAYAVAAKDGAKDPVGQTKALAHMMIPFWITEDHKAELIKKYVDNGPFRSLNALIRAILKGEKSVKIDVLK